MAYWDTPTYINGEPHRLPPNAVGNWFDNPPIGGGGAPSYQPPAEIKLSPYPDYGSVWSPPGVVDIPGGLSGGDTMFVPGLGVIPDP